MTDSQVPLDVVEGPAEPASPEQLRPSEPGIAGAPGAPAEASAQDQVAGTAIGPAPLETAEQATLHLPELNGSAVSHADAQPQLHLDTPPAPIEPEAAPEVDFPVPTLPAQDATSMALDPALPEAVPSPAETFAATRAEPTAPPEGHVMPPAEVLMEISPIFSALDAAEKAVAESERTPPPVAEPDFVIALPSAPADEEPVAEAPAPVEADQAGEAEPQFDSPIATESPAEQDPDAGAQLHDTASKIAEEAQATAAALESLKRLLDDKLPLLDPVLPPAAPPVVEPTPMRALSLQPPVPAYQASPRPVAPPPMVPLMPVPQPRMYAPIEPARRQSSVGGFLAGFALSWVIGAILYAYLTVIG